MDRPGPGDDGVRRPAPGLVRLSDATASVLAAVRAAGGRPYLVGGCVRDAVLHPGGRPADVDVEVYGLSADALVAALAPVGRVDAVGRSFAVLELRRDGEDLDVALPRRREASGALVADPHTTLRQASAGRDLTVNALAYDPVTEEVLDHWGGLGDLRDGVLRHVGPGLADDPLRVLRCARFSARLGFRVAPGTAELCRTLLPAAVGLPVERVWGEWRRIGETGRWISTAVDTLAATGWLATVPPLARLAGVAQDPRWHPEGDVLVHAGLAADAAARLADEAGLTGEDRLVVVLAALLHDVGKADHTQVRPDGRITSHGHAEGGVRPAEEFLQRVGAPRSVTARIAPLVREHMVATSVRGTPGRAAVRRLARRLVPATMAEWALVCAADHAGRGAGSGPDLTTAWLALAAEEQVQREPADPLLRGADLLARGTPPGPSVGRVLADALAAQDGGAFTDRAGALDWLDQRTPGPSSPGPSSPGSSSPGTDGGGGSP